MKLIVSILVVFGLHVTYAAEIISDPWSYSEKWTQAHAEDTSDTLPYGSSGCETLDESAIQLKILCTGTRTVLVWGGHEATGDFELIFTFGKLGNGTYEVLSTMD